MGIKSCDQLGTDLHDAVLEIKAKTGVTCMPSPMLLMCMIEDAEEIYGADAAFEDVIDTVLELQEPFTSEEERACYKVALGKVFGRRGAKKLVHNTMHGKYAPFAPR